MSEYHRSPPSVPELHFRCKTFVSPSETPVVIQVKYEWNGKFSRSLENEHLVHRRDKLKLCVLLNIMKHFLQYQPRVSLSNINLFSQFETESERID